MGSRVPLRLRTFMGAGVVPGAALISTGTVGWTFLVHLRVRISGSLKVIPSDGAQGRKSPRSFSEASRTMG